MSHRDACHWCTRKDSCYEQRGQCTLFVDKRKVRKEVLNAATGKNAVRGRMPDSELREPGEDDRSGSQDTAQLESGKLPADLETVRADLRSERADERTDRSAGEAIK